MKLQDLNRLLEVLETSLEGNESKQLELFSNKLKSSFEVTSEIRKTFDFDMSNMTYGLKAAFWAALEKLMNINTEDFPKIKNYRILKKLGEGGMGLVFLARQEYPIKRFVALKVLKNKFSRETLARFASEHQTLAMLDHPNIVKLLEIGETNDATPYYTMDYFSGVNIADFVSNKGLSVNQIIRLIIPVCEAIQHAHQRGIIHRDLKPRNVLVNISWDKPIVKVLDFGISITASRSLMTGDLVHTQEGAFIGTPEYMAPEQAPVDGMSIDIRADIYGVGALLYRLFTGLPPRDFLAKKKLSQVEFLSWIRNYNLKPPSHRVRNACAKVTHACPPKKLKGDLDWIVMKALSRDRDLRYESITAFVDDLRAFLNQRPTRAAPNHFFYRMKKLFQRQKFFVVSVLLVLVSLALGMSVAFNENRKAKGAARQTLVAKQLAMEEAEKFQTMNAFLLDMILAADPFGAQKGHVEISEMLDHATETIEHTFNQQPLVQAAIKNALGKTYYGLRRFDKADLLLVQALKTRQTILGNLHLDTMRTKSHLADLRWRQKRFDESRTLFQSIIHACEVTGAAQSEMALDAEVQLINQKRLRQKLKEAKKQYLDVLSRLRVNLGEAHKVTIEAKHGLANVQRRLGKYPESIELYQEVLDFHETRDGVNSVKSLGVKNNLANAFLAMGSLAEARALFAEVYWIHCELIGDDHPRSASVLANLALADFEAGFYQLASERTRAALIVFRKTLGEEHDHTIILENTEGLILHVTGKYEEAGRLFRQLYRLVRARESKQHPFALRLANNVALAFVYQGQFSEAQEILHENLPIVIETLGEDHPLTEAYFFTFGQLHLERSNYESAEKAFQQALVCAEKHLPVGHYRLHFIRAFLGYCMIKRDLKVGYKHFRAASPALIMKGFYPSRIRAFSKEIQGENLPLTP